MEENILPKKAIDSDSVRYVVPVGEKTLHLVKQCYQCGHDNADQAFCGVCGSPLNLNDYISKRVKDQLVDTIQNRDVLERDSSIKVFDKAWGWIKMILFTAVGLLVLAGSGVIWKASDLWSSIDKAKQSISDIVKKSGEEISRSSSQVMQQMSKEAQELRDAVVHTKTSIAETHAHIQSLEAELENARVKLQTASKMQPEIEDIRKQLVQAMSAIEDQQKVLSSSEEFIKSVFSSHMVEIFKIDQSSQGRYAVVPPTTKEAARTVVWILLDAAPIHGTLQLQYYISVQPPYSYFRIAHNLIVFFWGDPTERLQEKPLSISYFPDKSDKELIRSLSEHDGRVYADNEPLPKLSGPDPDFKGNKWISPEGTLLK
jgi:hypothetical protein